MYISFYTRGIIRRYIPLADLEGMHMQLHVYVHACVCMYTCMYM